MNARNGCALARCERSIIAASYFFHKSPRQPQKGVAASRLFFMKLTRTPLTLIASLAAAAAVIGADTTPKKSAKPAATTKPAAAPAKADAAPKADAPAKNEVLATVDGEKIMSADAEKAFAQIAAQRGASPDSVPAEQKKMMMGMLVNDLINEKLLNKACADIKVSPEEVNAEFDNILKQKGGTLDDAKKELAQMGMTIEGVKKDIGQRMQQRRYVEEQTKGKVQDPTDADAKEFFEKNPQYFEVPAQAEQVRASHILFLLKQDDAPEKVTAALKKAEASIVRAAKEDFATLAGELSEEPGAKERGGDLNFFPKEGAMVKEFADAAYALKKGEVSKEPVRSQFGYHVIKVTDTKPAQPAGKQTLEEAKPKIVAFLGKEKQRAAIDAMIAGLRAKAKVELSAAAQMPAPEAVATPPAAAPAPVHVPVEAVTPPVSAPAPAPAPAPEPAPAPAAK